MKLTHEASGTFAIAPTPFHDDKLVVQLATALTKVWNRLGLPLHVPDAEIPRIAVPGASTVIFSPAGG